MSVYHPLYFVFLLFLMGLSLLFLIAVFFSLFFFFLKKMPTLLIYGYASALETKKAFFDGLLEMIS